MGRYDAFKRVLDLVASAFLLLILSPLLVLLALLVWGNLGRPILFKQDRPGKGGHIFCLYKFRTMRKGGEHVQTNSAVEAVSTDANRLTRFGKILRATSLDELPELFNILRGDMSFVGPRPLLVEYLPLYSSEQARRHEVRPGLTGLAQASGRNALSWQDRFAQDIHYVDHRSFALDARILMRTVRAVFKREGISEEGAATQTPFTGNT